MKLSSLSVNGVCDLIDKIDSLNAIQTSTYKQVVKENNINGRVLLHCDLQELKKVIFFVTLSLDILKKKRKFYIQMYLCFSLGV